MRARWFGRLAGLTITASLLTAGLSAAHASGGAAVLTVRDPDGAELARVPLPDGQFALRYRNSVYRSTAMETFAVDDDSSFALTLLRAEELAVLEEYYRLAGPARPDVVLGWSGRPEQRLVLDELHVAATDLGKRTLVVAGAPSIELWRLVDDPAPTVVLAVERGP